MSDTYSQLPPWQAVRLAILVQALGEPELSQSELASLACIAGQESRTVQNLVAVIRRSRRGGGG